jgi:hypothetical protein
MEELCGVLRSTSKEECSNLQTDDLERVRRVS